MRKLQAFLQIFEGFAELEVSGVFDQPTFDAVNAFQVKYQSDVLTPWGVESSTGYVYITTKKKINELYCQKEFPLTASEIAEIENYRALMQALPVEELPIIGMDNEIEITTTGIIVGEIGQGLSVGQSEAQQPEVGQGEVNEFEPTEEMIASISETEFGESIKVSGEEESSKLAVATVSGLVNKGIVYTVSLIFAILAIVFGILFLATRKRKQPAIEPAIPMGPAPLESFPDAPTGMFDSTPSDMPSIIRDM